MNNSVKLRFAAAEDAAAIKKLVVAARLNPTQLDWRRFTVVIDPAENVIGCVQVKPHRDGSQELASLVVDEKYRGEGIARQLMENQIRNFKGELYLMCRSSLGEVYRKFGFVEIAEPEMPTYFRRISKLASIAEFLQKDGDTLLIMRCGAKT